MLEERMLTFSPAVWCTLMYPEKFRAKGEQNEMAKDSEPAILLLTRSSGHELLLTHFCFPTPEFRGRRQSVTGS